MRLGFLAGYGRGGLSIFFTKIFLEDFVPHNNEIQAARRIRKVRRIKCLKQGISDDRRLRRSTWATAILVRRPAQRSRGLPAL